MSLKDQSQARVGIIGGTGLYELEGVLATKTVYSETPWGKPSDEIHIGSYTSPEGDELSLAFLPRHGKGHFILPGKIPQKANIAALKMLGIEYILAFSAVGSLKEEIKPTHFVLPDQIIDRTKHRDDTYYGNGVVVHVSFGEPFSKEIASLVEDSIFELDITLHKNETLICMEGPAFSTRAESKLYKAWGAGIINMSVLPEAKLARELEISYQMICMSTDYDSWREEASAVTTEEIMKVVRQNSESANKILSASLNRLARLAQTDSPLKGMVKNSIITAPDKRPASTQEKLSQVLPGYF